MTANCGAEKFELNACFRQVAGICTFRVPKDRDIESPNADDHA